METRDDVKFIDAREIGTPLTNFARAWELWRTPKYQSAARELIEHLQSQIARDGGLYYDAHYPMSTPYSEYVAVEGLWDWCELPCLDETERVSIQKLLMQIIEWIYAERLDMTGIYDGRYTGDSFLNVFYIAWKLTGEEIWLERGRAGLEAALCQTAGHPGMKLYNNAAYYHQAALRGWFRDELVPLDTVVSTRAVYRPYEYSEPNFSWGKQGRRIASKASGHTSL